MYPKYRGRLFAIPNGGFRNKSTAVKLKKEGVLAGVWDIFLSVPTSEYGGLFIELKYGRNKLTEYQKAFRQANTGYKYEVVYTVDEFIKAVSTYLKLL